MIRPDKYTDPRFSVINVGALIIEELRENRKLTFNRLLNSLTEKTSEEVKHVYLVALSFLFVLGKLTYHQERDQFQLVD